MIVLNRCCSIDADGIRSNARDYDYREGDVDDVVAALTIERHSMRLRWKRRLACRSSSGSCGCKIADSCGLIDRY